VFLLACIEKMATKIVHLLRQYTHFFNEGYGPYSRRVNVSNWDIRGIFYYLKSYTSAGLNSRPSSDQCNTSISSVPRQRRLKHVNINSYCSIPFLTKVYFHTFITFEEK
jgi:hypothetical protein